jgi:uncharacterized glyoxalase superfamily protein PhnB
MFKSGKSVVIVDSVERAVKFYSEKLLFDIVDLKADFEGELHLGLAELRKGKCHIILRLPEVSELAEFSMVRRSSSRAVGMHIQIKKDINRYFDRCRAKGVVIPLPLSDGPVGKRHFMVKDPFGFFLIFSELESPDFESDDINYFVGFDMKSQPVEIKKGMDAPDDMIRWLKGFGITRRVAKKYIKVWVKKVGS